MTKSSLACAETTLSLQETELQPVIRMERVSRRFGTGVTAVTAVRDVDLTVCSGEYVAVMGASGSGKSTLLNIIGLLDRPTSGEYHVNGRPTARMPDREQTRLRARSIGFIFQAFHLVPFRTAVENVCLGLTYAGVPRGRRRELARNALDRVGMSHRENADPTTLSGGERQRVAIARAIATAPSLLLCDEPTGNLDSSTARDVMHLLTDLNRQGLTILLVTHDSTVAATTSRFLLMRDGRLGEAAAPGLRSATS